MLGPNCDPVRAPTRSQSCRWLERYALVRHNLGQSDCWQCGRRPRSRRRRERPAGANALRRVRKVQSALHDVGERIPSHPKEPASLLFIAGVVGPPQDELVDELRPRENAGSRHAQLTARSMRASRSSRSSSERFTASLMGRSRHRRKSKSRQNAARLRDIASDLRLEGGERRKGHFASQASQKV